MIYGYKCFNKGLINRYGFKFEVDKLYHASDGINFGINGNGFHMCINLEDTLRYFDAWNSEADICLVECFGKYIKRNDEYNGFYDIYACEYLTVKKVLTREEIIDYILKLKSNEQRICRFISLFKLTEEEKTLFYREFNNLPLVLEYLEYYQDNKKDVFRRKLIKEKK